MISFLQVKNNIIDNFVKDLKILLLDCDYGETHTDDILVDLIINGVKHKKVQERLLDKGQDLTLAKTIEIGRQYELSQSQIHRLMTTDMPSNSPTLYVLIARQC